MNFSELQKSVYVAKDKRSEFGNFNYRTAEGILSAIKAHLPDGASIVLTDAVQEVAGQIFVTSIATLTFEGGDVHEATGHAMHPITKKGMDPREITGAASSYARKYALSGLMALDDGSVDPDASKEPYQENTESAVATAIEQINAKQDMGALIEYWKNLYHNAKHIADDKKVIAAKDAKKAELEKV